MKIGMIVGGILLALTLGACVLTHAAFGTYPVGLGIEAVITYGPPVCLFLLGGYFFYRSAR